MCPVCQEIFLEDASQSKKSFTVINGLNFACKPFDRNTVTMALMLLWRINTQIANMGQSSLEDVSYYVAAKYDDPPSGTV